MAGEPGFDGLPGLPGPKGFQGDAGRNGPSGQQGPNGSRGMDGNPGFTGLQGFPGFKVHLNNFICLFFQFVYDFILDVYRVWLEMKAFLGYLLKKVKEAMLDLLDSKVEAFICIPVEFQLIN